MIFNLCNFFKYYGFTR